MKKVIVNILSISTLCLVLSSCSYWCQDYCKVHRYENFNSYVECPAPEKPVFKSMSSTYHIGGKHNLDIMSYNTILMMKWNDSLINTLECYKKQTKGMETLK